jgi:hypothetical protein
MPYSIRALKRKKNVVYTLKFPIAKKALERLGNTKRDQSVKSSQPTSGNQPKNYGIMRNPNTDPSETKERRTQFVGNCTHTGQRQICLLMFSQLLNRKCCTTQDLEYNHDKEDMRESNLVLFGCWA